MNKYFNLYGLIFVIVILIPNIVFSITCKDGFENRYQNRLVEILEQIGRFGCFISMFLMIPVFNKGFWLENGKNIYIIFGIALVAFAPCHILISIYECGYEIKDLASYLSVIIIASYQKVTYNIIRQTLRRSADGNTIRNAFYFLGGIRMESNCLYI